MAQVSATANHRTPITNFEVLAFWPKESIIKTASSKFTPAPYKFTPYAATYFLSQRKQIRKSTHQCLHKVSPFFPARLPPPHIQLTSLLQNSSLRPLRPPNSLLKCICERWLNRPPAAASREQAASAPPRQNVLAARKQHCSAIVRSQRVRTWSRARDAPVVSFLIVLSPHSCRSTHQNSHRICFS